MSHPRPRRTLAFTAARTPEAQAAYHDLIHRYEHVSAEEADVVVVLGGDGFMLETMHRHMPREPWFYGMNLGTVGFLLNQYREEALGERIERATSLPLHPLRMTALDRFGQGVESLAINEVSLFRETRQAAHLRVVIDGVTRLSRLICDGLLVATAAGSTAYNLSVQGPIIPIEANLLALTPISPFRPRRWRGALLPATARFHLRVLEPDKRPVSAVADYTEVRDVVQVDIWEDRETSLSMLFDPEHSLEERILKEQFLV